jgi:hypothetical protein
MLQLERDLPTTAEDIRILRELRTPCSDDPLVHANRLVAPGWTRQAAAVRPTFDGQPPFEL